MTNERLARSLVDSTNFLYIGILVHISFELTAFTAYQIGNKEQQGHNGQQGREGMTRLGNTMSRMISLVIITCIKSPYECLVLQHHAISYQTSFPSKHNALSLQSRACSAFPSLCDEDEVSP